jgi:O-antigen/teichoic acid export membrane protein
MGLLYVAVIYVVSNLPGFVFILVSLYKNYHYKFKFYFYKINWLIKESLPLLLFVTLAVLFQQIDILLLKYLKSEYEAGIYSAAMRLTLPLMIIPSAIINTVFPSMVRNIEVNEIKNYQMSKFIIKLLFFISFSITTFIGFKAREITIVIFGENYFNAYIPMLFLLIMQIFWFYNFFLINILTAYNKQRKIIAYAFVVLIPNIVFDVILIPEYSFNGAGLAKLISTALGTLLLFRVMMGEKLNYNFFNIKILFWTVASAGFLFLFSYLNLTFYIVLCIVTILFLTLKLRFFNDDEIMLILKLINKEKWSQKILKL